MLRLTALATVIISGTISTSFAQPIDSSGMPAKSPVMTNDQFKAAVDKFSKQTKSNVSQQVDQQLMLKPSGSSASPSMSSPATPSQPEQPSAYSNPSQPTTTTPASRPATTPPPATQAPASSSDIYTGFGQPTKQTTTPSSSSAPQDKKTNSNWNVGY